MGTKFEHPSMPFPLKEVIGANRKKKPMDVLERTSYDAAQEGKYVDAMRPIPEKDRGTPAAIYDALRKEQDLIEINIEADAEDPDILEAQKADLLKRRQALLNESLDKTAILQQASINERVNSPGEEMRDPLTRLRGYQTQLQRLDSELQKALIDGNEPKDVVKNFGEGGRAVSYEDATHAVSELKRALSKEIAYKVMLLQQQSSSGSKPSERLAEMAQREDDENIERTREKIQVETREQSPIQARAAKKELRRTKKEAFSEQLEKIRLMKDICYKAVDNVEKRATFKKLLPFTKSKKNYQSLMILAGEIGSAHLPEFYENKTEEEMVQATKDLEEKLLKTLEEAGIKPEEL